MSKKVVLGFIKMLSIVTLSLTALDAKIINGIAMTVDSEPITLYEIEELVQTLKIDRQKAIDILIDRKIEEKNIKSFGIEVSKEELKDHMFQKALGFNLSIFEFEKLLKEKGIDLEEYKEDLSQKIKKDKLLGEIVAQGMKEPSERDLQSYYKNNPSLFEIPNSINVIKYQSKNDQELLKFMNAPLMRNDSISQTEQTLHQQDIDKNFWLMLSSTPKRSFTQIIPTQSGFTTYFVSEKQDIQKLSFEEAKGIARARYLKEQEDRIIEDFYKKSRASANINVISGN